MRILIHVDGGVVQSVSTDTPCEAEVVVLDYDSEGGGDAVCNVPQSDDPDDTEEAVVTVLGLGQTDRQITEFLNKMRL